MEPPAEGVSGMSEREGEAESEGDGEGETENTYDGPPSSNLREEPPNEGTPPAAGTQKRKRSVKDRLKGLGANAKVKGTRVRERLRSLRADAKVKGAHAKEKLKLMHADAKVTGTHVKRKLRSMHADAKVKGTRVKRKLRDIRADAKVKGTRARERLRSIRADAKVKKLHFITRFMYNCHTAKLKCLACWRFENPKLVMKAIKARESACAALIPSGYGIIIHKSLVLTTYEYVSDSKKALYGEVLLNYGNHKAHSPSLSCIPSETKIARGLAPSPKKSTPRPTTPRSKQGSKGVSKGGSRGSKAGTRAGSRTCSKARSKAGTPPSTPKRPHTHKLLPSRIFMTNPGLDLTLLTCDPVPREMKPLGLGQARNKRNVELDRHVYILGHMKSGDTHSPLSIGKGRIVEMDALFVKFVTETENWVPGSAGFDERGNFAFLVCNPKKVEPAPPPLPESEKQPNVRPQKKERVEHMGVLVQGIRQWITEHWEEGTFNKLVPPLGRRPPLTEPLPEGYSSQTLPTDIKQKWSPNYNKAPTYAELALFLDVYNRLAALRRECTHAEKERKHQERHRLQSISKEWLTDKEDAEYSPRSSASRRKKKKKEEHPNAMKRASDALCHTLAHRQGHQEPVPKRKPRPKHKR